jgi:hypothetical protein
MSYNILILADKGTNKNYLGHVMLQVGELYKKNMGVEVVWTVEDYDYGDYPVVEYWGGYEGIAQSWIAERTKEIWDRKHESIDTVMFAIPSSNWRLTGVWGWNHSAHFNGYGVQQVRLAQVASHTDERNINNSVGTLYHELHHDLDSFVFNYTGVVVEKLYPNDVRSHDNDVTHGEHADWQYIRHKENQESLKIVAASFRQAVAKRRELYQDRVTKMQTIVQLLEQYVVLLRMFLSKQRGEIAILPNNKCNHGS